MDDKILDLSEMEKDALKEVGNIGAGNAATAFAQLLNREIDMTVPAVKILPLTEIHNVIGNEEQKVAGVLLKVLGQAPGKILFILTRNSINYLSNIILDRDINTDEIDELQTSLCKEIGNILSGSYLSSINKITGLNLIQSVPGFSYDMCGAIFSSSIISLSKVSDYIILIETEFMDGKKKIDGYFFMIPEVGSLQKILQGLGFDINE